MTDLSVQQLLTRLGAVVVLTAVHGFALALAAVLMGDRGPRADGRLTLNPLVHLDLLGAVGFVVFQAGWTKPVAVDARLVRFGIAGVVLIVLLALATTLAVATGIAATESLLLSRVTDASLATGLAGLVRTILELAVWFVLLNLVPIPPLAMGLVLRALAPTAMARVDRYAIWVGVALLAVLAIGVFQPALRPVYQAILGMLAVGG